VRKFFYGLGLMLFILLSSAFVQPMDASQMSELPDTSEDSKGKKKKKKMRFRRR
jgi:hypothetical protein